MRLWANPPADPSELAEDFRLFGLEDQIPKRTAPEFELWPENVESWQVFAASVSQWRWLVGMGGVMRTGLDYSALQSTMTMMGVVDQKAVFEDVRLMEMEALALLNR